MSIETPYRDQIERHSDLCAMYTYHRENCVIVVICDGTDEQKCAGGAGYRAAPG